MVFHESILPFQTWRKCSARRKRVHALSVWRFSQGGLGGLGGQCRKVMGGLEVGDV